MTTLAKAAHAAGAIQELENGRASLNAFLAVAHPESLAVANSEGLLAGIPLAVKDNLATTGFDTTCGSKVLEGYRSPYELSLIHI